MSGDRHAVPATDERGTSENLIVNGSFSQSPNPLAFWTNAPGAFVTWVNEGANGSQGAAHLRFLPPVSRGAAARGAVYYTGLTQCVAIPGPGRYLLRGFARVPEGASGSSIAGLAWRIREDSPTCSGPFNGNGRVGISRSATWNASTLESIRIYAQSWTPGTTIEIQVEVGDSSTASIEAVEAVVDEISLLPGSLFRDGFEE